MILTEQSTVHEGLMAGECQDLRLSSSGIMASCVDVCYMRIASLSTCMKPRDFLVNGQRECFPKRLRLTKGMVF